MTKNIIIIADYTEQSIFSVDELCEICGIKTSLLEELIEYEILVPIENQPGEWVFDMQQLKRLRAALRLQRDLELNLAGVALVMHLLEEMEELRARSELIDRHLLK